MDKRRILTASGVLIVAAATGHIMQYGGATAARIAGSGAQAPSPAAPSAPELSDASLPVLPRDLNIPALALPEQGAVAVRVAAANTGFVVDMQSDVQTPTPFELACSVQISSEAKPAAMIAVSFRAPCQANTVIDVTHNGLTFTALTDQNGQFKTEIPALESEAKVSITLDDGQVAETVVSIDDLASFSRAAVVWAGDAQLQVHAFEYGAEFGENGHVWADAAGSTEQAILAKGGFLTQLGSRVPFGTKLAEVYSFPANKVQRAGVVRLVVEAEVTENSCGTQVLGQSIERDSDGQVRTAALSLNMPDCDSAGGYLVLKNLLQDLKIARN